MDKETSDKIQQVSKALYEHTKTVFAPHEFSERIIAEVHKGADNKTTRNRVEIILLEYAMHCHETLKSIPDIKQVLNKK